MKTTSCVAGKGKTRKCKIVPIAVKGQRWKLMNDRSDPFRKIDGGKPRPFLPELFYQCF